MKKFFIAVMTVLLLSTKCFAQCETYIDGYQYCHLDISDYNGISPAPAISNIGQARVYFDLSSGKLKCSENGGAYSNCVGTSGSFAPSDAKYLTQTTDATLSNEFSIGSLTTGLLLNTVSAGTGTPSAYTGTSCTNQFPRSLNASGSATCASVSMSADTTGVLPVANGGTNASSASITAFNNITGYTASGATGTTSTNLVFSTSPSLTTPTIGVATATSVNKMAITAPATSSTLAVADGKTFTASNTITLTGTDTVTMNVSNNKLVAVGGAFDGGGSVIASGSTTYINCPFAGTITGYSILVDTGTVTIKTWKKATGTAIPTVSDVISTSGVSLSSGTAVRSATVSDFTSTTVSANDIFAFNITAIAGATKIFFQLEITKN